MTRQEIEREVKNVFQREFEIDNPDMDADLRETYEFDSIDAIELLLAIETFLNTEITQEEKKQAGRAAGATGWLVKPFMPDKLLAVVNKVLPN